MFMQQQGEEEGDDEGGEGGQFVIDAHTMSVMNTMFGGGLNHLLGGMGEGDDSSEEMAGGDYDIEDEDEEEEEEEETKEDIYMPVSDTGTTHTSGALWSSLPVHHQISAIENTEEEEDCGADDYDDDDDDDEAYSRLSSRY
jgi:hypothetical protein